MKTYSYHTLYVCPWKVPILEGHNQKYHPKFHSWAQYAVPPPPPPPKKK